MLPFEDFDAAEILAPRFSLPLDKRHKIGYNSRVKMGARWRPARKRMRQCYRRPEAAGEKGRRGRKGSKGSGCAVRRSRDPWWHGHPGRAHGRDARATTFARPAKILGYSYTMDEKLPNWGAKQKEFIKIERTTQESL